MIIRTLSGALLLACAAILFYFGGIWLALSSCILSTIGIYELLRVYNIEKHSFGWVAYIGNVLYYILIFMNQKEFAIALFILELSSLIIIYIIRYPEYNIDDVAKAFFAIIYVGVMLSYLYQTRALNDAGRWLTWIAIIGSWGSDTFAYLVGKFFGKHHFSKLSPKKTIEGCIGGVIGATLLGFAYSYVFEMMTPDRYSAFFHIPTQVVFPIVTFICSIFAQIGDLAASAIKRRYHTKDYGDIIPGHGGVLDRFDSVIFVAPFVYYLLKLSTYIH